MDADAYLAVLEIPDLETGEVEHEYLVSLQQPEVHSTTVGEQGPPGRPGPPAASPEAGPAFTYTHGRVSRIDYASGAYKAFTYGAGGELAQLDYVTDAGTTRKSFEYNPDGSLAAIEQVEL